MREVKSGLHADDQRLTEDNSSCGSHAPPLTKSLLFVLISRGAHASDPADDARWCSNRTVILFPVFSPDSIIKVLELTVS